MFKVYYCYKYNIIIFKKGFENTFIIDLGKYLNIKISKYITFKKRFF